MEVPEINNIKDLVNEMNNNKKTFRINRLKYLIWKYIWFKDKLKIRKHKKIEKPSVFSSTIKALGIKDNEITINFKDDPMSYRYSEDYTQSWRVIDEYMKKALDAMNNKQLFVTGLPKDTEDKTVDSFIDDLDKQFRNWEENKKK